MSDAASLILGDAPPAGGDAAPPGDGAPPATPTPEPAPGGDDSPFSWAGELSDEAPGAGKPSDKAWLENKGYKSPGDMIAAMRALESNVGGRLAMPKGDDDVDGWNALYKAIGRPDTPEGYDIKAAEGEDPSAVNAFTQKAHELGLSARQAAGLNTWFENFAGELVAGQSRDMKADAETAVTELRGAWGGGYDKNVELSRRAAERFGFDRETLNAMSQHVGTRKMMETMYKLGREMGEDSFDGGGDGKLGTMNAEQAKAELDALHKDPEFVKKLQAGEPAATARREKLIAIQASALQKQMAE